MSNQYSRIVEKNIFVDIDIDAGGSSEVVDLSAADKFSCQAIYTVDTPVDAVITFQCSNDGTNWTAIQAGTSIVANGTTMLEVAEVDYRYFRVLKALTSGDVDLECLVLVIGDAT